MSYAYLGMDRCLKKYLNITQVKIYLKITTVIKILSSIEK